MPNVGDIVNQLHGAANVSRWCEFSNFYTLLCLLHTQRVTWSIAFTARLSLRALPSPNSQHWYNKPSPRSSRYVITFKEALITAHATFPLVVAHSSLTTSRSLTGRGRRRCYPATIQYPGERRSKHCVRRRAQLPRDHAGVGDDVDTVAGSRTQLPRELCWRCTTAQRRASTTPEGIMHSMPAL